MQYRIFGDSLPAVEFTFTRGESIFTQSGGMTWMSDGFAMDTNMKGGLMKGLGRMLTGESLFMATYTAERDNVQMTLASTFPGSIKAIELDSTRTLICQKSAFLCATPGVELSMAVTKAKAGLFGGEGFLMQRISGKGVVFLEIDGTVVEKDLAAGEKIKVDTGNVVCMEGTVTYSAEMVKGFKNILFGGEGLFLSSLEGPGKVYLQTINMQGFVGKIMPFIPVKSGN